MSAQVDESSANRELVLDAVELLAAFEHHSAAAGPENLNEIWVGLADDDRTVGLDDAGFLAGNIGLGGAGKLGVIERNVGDDGDLSVDHVG